MVTVWEASSLKRLGPLIAKASRAPRRGDCLDSISKFLFK